MNTEMPANTGPKVGWLRTERATARALNILGYEKPREGDREAPHGRYHDRPVLGRDMENVIGSVYLGAGAREAIVTDDRRAENRGDAYLKDFFENQFLPNLEHQAHLSGKFPRELALQMVYLTVLGQIQYDARKTDELIRQLSGKEPDARIHLASFLMSHVGVCRHQALACGYLLQKLKESPDPRFRLTGHFSIDRNEIADANEGIVGAHVWTRYTSSTNQVMILDVAQQKFGFLEELRRMPDSWEYLRPEERNPFSQR